MIMISMILVILMYFCFESFRHKFLLLQFTIFSRYPILTYIVPQSFCNVLVMTPGPLLPQTSPRKFFLRSRTQASATRRPNFDMSKPMTPAATSSQSSAPAKFVRFSNELVTTTSRSR